MSAAQPSLGLPWHAKAAWALFAAAVACAAQHARVDGLYQPVLATALFTASTLALLAGFWCWRGRQAQPLAWALALLGCLALALWGWPKGMPYGALAFFLSLGAVGLGTAAAPVDRRPPAWATVLALGLLVFGVVLRCWDLHASPPGVSYDEAITAQNWGSLLARDGAWPGPFSPEYHYLGLQAQFSAVGKALGFDGYMAMRAGFALAGSLSLAVLYALAMELFGWRTALWTLAFAAGSNLALLSSRVCAYDAVGVLAFGLAAYWLLRGLRTGSWLRACAGAGLLSQFLYGRYYTHYCMAAFLLAYLGWQGLGAWRGPLAGRWRLFAACIALFLLGALPMAKAIHEEGVGMFMNRARELVVSSDSVPEPLHRFFLEKAAKYYRSVAIQGPEETATQALYRPLMDPWAAALLVLGIAAALATRGLNGAGLFAAAWLLASWLPALIGDKIVATYRLGLQTMGVQLLVGLAASRLSEPPKAWAWRPAAWLGRGLAALALLLSSAWSLNEYFAVNNADPVLYERRGGVFIDLGRRLRAEAPGVDVRVAHGFYLDLKSVQARALAGRPLRWCEAGLPSLLPPMEGRETLLVVEPSAGLLQPSLQYLYPGSSFEMLRDPAQLAPPGSRLDARDALKGFEDCLFGLYRIPAAALQAEGAPLPPADGQGFRRGLFQAPKTGLYRPVMPDQAQVEVDGRRLQAGKNYRLSAGLHWARWQGPAEGAFILKDYSDGPAPDIDFRQGRTWLPARFAQGWKARHYALDAGTLWQGPQGLKPVALQLLSDPRSGAGRPVQARSLEPVPHFRWGRMRSVDQTPLPVPYFTVLEAQVSFPGGGEWSLYDLNGSRRMQVWVDGRAAYEPGPQGRPQRHPLLLAPGPHSVRVQFINLDIWTVGPSLMAQRGQEEAVLLPARWCAPVSLP